MSCHFPLKGWIAKKRNASGKRSVVFDAQEGFSDRQITVPCGQCFGCRLDRTRDWAVRIMHEASLKEDNCFLTLTYHTFPPGGSLCKPHFTAFMKNLRQWIVTHDSMGKFIPEKWQDLPMFKDRRVRFFQCGEYGDQFGRPHHHAILFGFDFFDKELWKVENGSRLYRSPLLERLWPHGYSTIGNVTYDSASYVARYTLKKLNGDIAEAHYRGRIPEYVTMSRRPGIGHFWIERYLNDVYPSDSVVVRGKNVGMPPRFYDKKYELTDPRGSDTLKAKRIVEAILNNDNTPSRLFTKSEFMKKTLKNKIRRFESYDTQSLCNL